jgi:hypothetical protein
LDNVDVHLTLIVEDILSETVLRQIVAEAEKPVPIASCLITGGSGKIESNIGSYRQMAERVPCVVILDLDRRECAPGYVNHLLPKGHSRYLVVRIAVREVESWLLADAVAFAAFSGVAASVIPRQPDAVPDPKDSLLNLIRRSRKKRLKEVMLPQFAGSPQGPEYNAELQRFVQEFWKVERASVRSPSLARAVTAINALAARVQTPDGPQL